MAIASLSTHVEQGFGAIAPWETLVSDSQVFVFDELRTVHGHLLVLQVSVQHAQTDGWEGNEERQTLPQLPSAS